MMSVEVEVDAVGVGIGPANLSMAALSQSEETFRTLFFERSREICWHSELLYSGATMQTSFLEDLVTPVDPTNANSFLSFLASSGRMYEFICSGYNRISRLEFQEYLRWVSRRLSTLRFDEAVNHIEFRSDHFAIETGKRNVRSNAVVIGVGAVPNIPRWARRALGGACFVAGELLSRAPRLGGKTVAVVGGGQTGAETALALASGQFGEIARIIWLSRSPHFQAMEDSPLVNEVFTPQYSRFFQKLPSGTRRALAEGHRDLDGISYETAERIYQHTYLDSFAAAGRSRRFLLYPGVDIEEIRTTNGALQLLGRSKTSQREVQFAVDTVVLCTGYSGVMPECLAPLRHRLSMDEFRNPQLSNSYRVAWDGPPGLTLYAQNMGRYSHGIADPQLSAVAWRSAVILNDLLGVERFNVRPPSTAIQWEACADEDAPMGAAAYASSFPRVAQHVFP